MGIEEDLSNLFKYADLTGTSTPMEMIRTMMKTLEVDMLKKMRSQIDARIGELGTQDKSLDPFSILGVTPNSTRAEVDKAYKEKAWKAHPDHGGSHEDMVKVNASYQAIRRFKNWK